ncbi:hypothetical protein MR810_10060 [bacterium]|nr:hypothetical protein [bacterium]
MKTKKATFMLCAAIIVLYIFQTGALGEMSCVDAADGKTAICPFRAEPCETCNNGTLRSYMRRGDQLDNQLCTHMPWNTHELYQMYNHYICDNCGAEGYALRAGKWWWCTYQKAYYDFIYD